MTVKPIIIKEYISKITAMLLVVLMILPTPTIVLARSATEPTRPATITEIGNKPVQPATTTQQDKERQATTTTTEQTEEEKPSKPATTTEEVVEEEHIYWVKS